MEKTAKELMIGHFKECEQVRSNSMVGMLEDVGQIMRLAQDIKDLLDSNHVPFSSMIDDLKSAVSHLQQHKGMYSIANEKIEMLMEIADIEF